MARSTKVQGRPTIYTEELANEICETISCSNKGLAILCKENPHWPHRSNIFRWLNKYEIFRDKYARAKANQVEILIDDIVTIADDDSNDTTIRTSKNGDEYECANSEWINRSRLRIDTRKWIAAKLAPKLYGEKKSNSDDDKPYDESMKELE